MNLPTALRTIQWMIWDTLRQSLATRLFWIILGMTLVCVVFCLSVSIEGGDPLPTDPGEAQWRLPPNDPEVKKLGPEKIKKEGVDVFRSRVTYGFGYFPMEAQRDRTDSVRFIHILLSWVVAGMIGIFLVLMWTAGFMPSFLDPQQVTVMLAKPVPRWSLLLGKYLGVIVFVTIQAAIFVLSTWLALGLKTGVYDPLYLLSVPLLVIHFGVFYSFSVMLAVWTRSTVACVFGTLLFWLMCWGMNLGRHALEVYASDTVAPSGHRIADVGYWILPKPADMGILQFDALKADAFSIKWDAYKTLQETGRFHPEWTLISCFIFTLVMLGISVREFQVMDY